MLSTLATPEGLAYAVAVAGGAAIVIRTFVKGLKEGEKSPVTATNAPAPPPSVASRVSSGNGEEMLVVLKDVRESLRSLERTQGRILETQTRIHERGERDAIGVDEAVRTLERTERVVSRIEEVAERAERSKRAEGERFEILGGLLGQIRDLLKYGRVMAHRLPVRPEDAQDVEG